MRSRTFGTAVVDEIETAKASDARARHGAVNLRTLLALIAIFCGFMLSAEAAPKGGGGGGGGGGSVPQSNAGLPIPAPQSTVISDFRSFYVVLDGGEPLFQTFGTELVASDLSNAFLVQPPGPVPSSSSNATTAASPALSSMAPPAAPPFYFVAAAGWTEDTLNAACKNDPNAIGGLVIKYSAFYTQGNWLVYTTEREHVQPQFIFVSCANGVASHATPAITVHTEKSPAQWAVPIAPIAGLSALFTFKGQTTAAYQVKYGTLLLTTAIGGFSGDIGILNPGHEALGVGARISHDAVQIVQSVCNIPNPQSAYHPSSGENYQTLETYPSVALLQTMLAGENATWGKTPSASPTLDLKPWTAPVATSPTNATASSTPAIGRTSGTSTTVTVTTVLTNSIAAPSSTPAPTTASALVQPLHYICGYLAGSQ